ncbi:hypothetical protein LCGC14_2014890 [marine sediment metagenome]|uniref:Uncharacterized protein n=1 Tax=marine sediment metagenome TaxID=412755 RepID=A0A0F9HCM1_9ZZZZ
MAHILKLAQRQAAGTVLITDLESGPYEQTRDTVMCKHCQKHWVPQPGSGKQRGYCMRCRGVTCGKEACETDCVPWELAIEIMEARGRVDRNIAAIRS